jgi:hypothetical protein
MAHFIIIIVDRRCFRLSSKMNNPLYFVLCYVWPNSFRIYFLGKQEPRGATKKKILFPCPQWLSNFGEISVIHGLVESWEC